jgi:hypothetical protein
VDPLEASARRLIRLPSDLDTEAVDLRRERRHPLLVPSIAREARVRVREAVKRRQSFIGRHGQIEIAGYLFAIATDERDISDGSGLETRATVGRKSANVKALGGLPFIESFFNKHRRPTGVSKVLGRFGEKCQRRQSTLIQPTPSEKSVNVLTIFGCWADWLWRRRDQGA